jgi:hypothetical protein
VAIDPAAPGFFPPARHRNCAPQSDQSTNDSEIGCAKGICGEHREIMAVCQERPQFIRKPERNVLDGGPMQAIQRRRA